MIKYLEITEGDCFYNTENKSIVRIDKVGGYYITITKVAEYNVKIKNYKELALFKSNNISYDTIDIPKNSLIKLKNSVKINPQTVFKITTLLRMNMSVCRKLLSTFKKSDCENVNCYITTSTIDLDTNHQCLRISENSISFVENPQVFPSPTYCIGVEDYNKLNDISEKTYQTIKDILDNLKEGA